MKLRLWESADAAALLDLVQTSTDLERQMPLPSTLHEAQQLIEGEWLPAQGRAVFCLDDGQAVGLVGITYHAQQEDGTWEWVLTQLGFSPYQQWQGGQSWQARDGSYIVLEQSPHVSGTQERTRAGLNHLALTCPSTHKLDSLREQAAEHGWSELFAQRYPHAGGPEHYALYLENTEGFELEIVAPC